MADKLRIKQVDEVQFLSGGISDNVSLRLERHHLVMTQIIIPPSEASLSKDKPAKSPAEIWIAYPVIANSIFRPTAPNSGFSPSIRLRGRDFRFMTLNFNEDRQARDVYESIKTATCRLGSIEKLYAFSYRPPPQEKAINGWEVYDPKAEWRRQGVSEKDVDRGWRISKLNLDYVFSPTYPRLLVVPTSISDNTLNYAVKYRSRARIPALTYLHPVNNCAITRSSQPIVGMRGNRSIQDEKLVSACFTASGPVPGEEAATDGAFSSLLSRNSSSSSVDDFGIADPVPETTDTEQLEDDMVYSASIEIVTDKPLIYGAQRHNLIVDARPTINALAMQAIGLGSENMDHYKFAGKAYLGIDNIHVMRTSLENVIATIKDSDVSALPPNRTQLQKSDWLKHITCLLDGSALIARQVGIQHSNVLIHCSDGWDRTSQLSALAQLLLDPYYRTIDGIIVLIEKDWVSFGHKFQHRTGFLSSEKWFKTENDALAGTAIQPGGSGDGRGDALENALLSAKRFFNKSIQGSPSSQNAEAADSDGEMQSIDDSPKPKKMKGTSDDLAAKEATKPRETSPVFHQFLDATYQLVHQYPTRFEFNKYFLKRLFYHLYSCQYGTFLYNDEKSRFDVKLQERTTSVWSYFLSRRPEFTNPLYDAEIDDHVKGKERLIFPRLDKIRWWNEVFNKKDEEMNGPANSAAERYLPNTTSTTPALTGIETSTAAVGAPAVAHKQVANGSVGGGAAATFANLRDGIAGLGIGKSMGGSGAKSPGPVKREMEVEMH
ncbi:protein-tyrosine phosphatase-like protein [Calycina marina]|uniref:Protein-tyrosine phosphatase-like protein n=1 Tax=Calycina marina TaxID=1763456 RepID=A0A9P7Z2B7_9HELO|nr:protein-tyrosine phosphatase-like protein [Calycina marina]